MLRAPPNRPGGAWGAWGVAGGGCGSAGGVQQLHKGQVVSNSFSLASAVEAAGPAPRQWGHEMQTIPKYNIIEFNHINPWYK